VTPYSEGETHALDGKAAEHKDESHGGSIEEEKRGSDEEKACRHHQQSCVFHVSSLSSNVVSESGLQSVIPGEMTA
jgi:hypothetical protein